MVKESGWITQSIHETRKGAELAMEEHKKEVLKEFTSDDEKQLPFITMHDWRVVPFELLD